MKRKDTDFIAKAFYKAKPKVVGDDEDPVLRGWRWAVHSLSDALKEEDAFFDDDRFKSIALRGIVRGTV